MCNIDYYTLQILEGISTSATVALTNVLNRQTRDGKKEQLLIELRMLEANLTCYIDNLEHGKPIEKDIDFMI